MLHSIIIPSVLCEKESSKEQEHEVQILAKTFRGLV